MTKPKLIMCTCCIAAVRSRGEKLSVMDLDLSCTKETDTCNWCDEEVSTDELRGVDFID